MADNGRFLLGLLGFALPLTLFYGADGLVTVTENAAELGVVLLIVYVFAKNLATSGAISSGIIPIPLALGVYALLIAGLPIIEGVPVLIAGLISFMIVKGLIAKTHKVPPKIG